MRQGVVAALAGAIVVAGLVAATVLPGRLHGDGQKVQTAGTENVQIGGPFTLIDGHGKTVTDRDFRGRYMLIYFGYTRCPDACPTTLNDMASALDKMPEAARKKVVPIFITVDPARDTPDVIGDYAEAFGAEFVGLTGDEGAVAQVTREYHVYAQKHKLAHGDYAMDHSSIMYVMGPDGHYVGVISDGSKPSEIAEQLVAFGA